MPVIEQTIFSTLSTSPDVAPLVPSARIYPIELPQNSVLPAIVYHRISTDPDRTLQGRSGLERPRIQVDVYTDGATPAGYGQAKRVAVAVKHALDTVIGFAGQDEGREPDTKRYRIRQDYQGLLVED